MIYLKILDNAGFGNQLFMYAMGYALANDTNQTITILSEFNRWSRRSYLLDKLNLSQEYIQKVYDYYWIKNYYVFRIIKKINNIVLRHSPFNKKLIQPFEAPNQYINFVKNTKNYFVEGYWENFNYFNYYKNDLKKQLRVAHIDDAYTMHMIERVQKSDSVALHIRLGDFVKDGRAFEIGYFIRAMRQMRALVPGCHFYVFSLSIEVKELLSTEKDVTVIKGTKTTRDIDEWEIMKSCRHHIVSNSTFSWWAAYLAQDAGKIVLKPSKKYFIKVENKSVSDYNAFFESAWITVED